MYAPLKKNIKTINKIEMQSVPISTTSSMRTKQSRFNTFYKEELKIGYGYDFDEESAREEIDKLMYFLISNEFVNEYKRSYNIIDMYLTTNIQARDILETYEKYCNVGEKTILRGFIYSTISRVDNANLWALSPLPSPHYSGRALSSRFYRPTKNVINQLKELNFYSYNKIEGITIDDAEEAYKILLDLNEKYGVKFDDISYYYILESYKNNEINTYYEIAKKYKSDLDKKTHVQKRCIPLLTRREINSKN